MATLKTLIQCDFDGTVTEEDAAFYLLDEFAQGDWRRVLQDYRERKISVADFSIRAFAMVKADKSTLLDTLRERVRVRAGFCELVDYCLRRGFRFVIVSNGLDFYIRAVLRDIGLEDIEVHAAQPAFHAKGMKVKYVGPDGEKPRGGFKETYTKLFLRLGYRVIYIGNGDSDIAPAQYAHRVFATDELLALCGENNLRCEPFGTFFDVVKGLALT
jgi:2-hydroxy-3-keto-5-methylthiopentenyl-1-phosphate phosphatase